LILLVALSVIVIPPPTQALAHEGNSSHRSEIRRVQPDIPGLSIEVLNYDDRLLLVNRSGKTAFVRGYDDEPYLRIRSGGAVEVNKRSPTYYLNEDRFAQVDVPAQADEKAPPRWEVVGSSGRYEWHDHRIHWMSRSLPPKAEAAKDKPHHVFDWTIPARLDGKPLAIDRLARLPAAAERPPEAAARRPRTRHRRRRRRRLASEEARARGS